MQIVEKIAMWGGLAGIIISIFAIVILFLTRRNIIDLLDRDVIMYDKNYELKKEAFQSAFDVLDTLAQYGADMKNNPQFVPRAKEAYNGLLCTVYSAKLYQEFYKYAVDTTVNSFSVEELEQFKVSCRSELIGKAKKGESFKGNIAQPVQQPQPRPMPQRPAQPKPAPRPNPPQAPKAN